MPKLKTKRSAAKRFKITGGGKILRRRAFKSHLLSKKTAKRKRRLRRSALISGADVARTRKLLPYGG